MTPASVAVGDFNGDGKLDLGGREHHFRAVRRGLRSKATCCSATATARSAAPVPDVSVGGSGTYGTASP